jgi:hypothetical protein
LASARDGGRRASVRMVLAHRWLIWVAGVWHLREKFLLRLARASDGDGHGCHILSWKHRREVCVLLRLRPRLRREKPRIRDQTMEALLCLFLVRGIV